MFGAKKKKKPLSTSRCCFLNVFEIVKDSVLLA